MAVVDICLPLMIRCTEKNRVTKRDQAWIERERERREDRSFTRNKEYE